MARYSRAIPTISAAARPAPSSSIRGVGSPTAQPPPDLVLSAPAAAVNAAARAGPSASSAETNFSICLAASALARTSCSSSEPATNGTTTALPLHPVASSSATVL